MTEQSLVEIALFALGGLFSLMWWLLQQKDAKQQSEMEEIKKVMDETNKTLWRKHDEDSEQLRQLELRIASEHYVKTELDAKFDRMETTFREGFKDLSGKIDELSKVLITQFKASK